MSRPEYLVVAEYTGNGATSEYTFDYKISDLSQLLILKTDDEFTKVFKLRGDDDIDTYIDSIDFDADAGGGTVTLVDDLETGYHLVILLANDAPTQPQKFKNRSDFTLSLFEAALDLQNGAIQRVSYLAQRSLRLSDSFPSTDSFDTEIPIHSTDTNVENNAGKLIAVGTDNASIELGPTTAEIFAAEDAAEAAAVAAAVSEAAALASQVAAANSAAAASASAAAALASQIAAAASAVAAMALFETFVGSKAVPTQVTAAGGVSFTSVAYQTTMFLKSNGGAVAVIAAQPIQNGTIKGQRLKIIGSSDADYFDLVTGGTLQTFNQTVRIGLNSIANFIWDETNWILEFYNGVIP